MKISSNFSKIIIGIIAASTISTASYALIGHGTCNFRINNYNAEIIGMDAYYNEQVTVIKPEEVTCSIDNEKSAIPVLTCLNNLKDAFHRVNAWTCNGPMFQTQWIKNDDAHYTCQLKSGVTSAPAAKGRLQTAKTIPQSALIKSSIKNANVGPDTSYCDVQLGSHAWNIVSNFFEIGGWVQIVDSTGVCTFIGENKTMICKFPPAYDQTQVQFYGYTCKGNQFVEVSPNYYVCK